MHDLDQAAFTALLTCYFEFPHTYSAIFTSNHELQVVHLLLVCPLCEDALDTVYLGE